LTAATTSVSVIFVKTRSTQPAGAGVKVGGSAPAVDARTPALCLLTLLKYLHSEKFVISFRAEKLHRLLRRFFCSDMTTHAVLNPVHTGDGDCSRRILRLSPNSATVTIVTKNGHCPWIWWQTVAISGEFGIVASDIVASVDRALVAIHFLGEPGLAGCPCPIVNKRWYALPLTHPTASKH